MDFYIKPSKARPQTEREKSQQRDKYARDILQPTNRQGHVNPKFVKAYGTQQYDDEVQQWYTKKYGVDPNNPETAKRI